MNSGFFATADGVKVIEFNARFGDPECMNIMSLLDGSWPHAMERIAAGSLSAADVPLRRQASVVLYLVSPDYALRAGPPYEFALDIERLQAHGCEVFFSSAVEIGPDTYRTVGTSRAVALASTAPTLEQARADRGTGVRARSRCSSGAATWATRATWTACASSSTRALLAARTLLRRARVWRISRPELRARMRAR